VKFAELSQNRLTDYVFAWDRMLALQGDTAPYLQYSTVRIRSIFRKLDAPFDATAAKSRSTRRKIHLARLHARFGELLPLVLEDFRPNLLANYLLELARAFHSFFEACPVLKSDEAVRSSRLALCELTARILTTGLGLLSMRKTTGALLMASAARSGCDGSRKFRSGDRRGFSRSRRSRRGGR
jgi:arginyl-tRNA synthetase